MDFYISREGWEFLLCLFITHFHRMGGHISCMILQRPYTANCMQAQSVGCVQLSATPWTVACQDSLSLRMSQARMLE